MSKETLKLALTTKEASLPFFRRGMIKALGAGSGVIPRGLGATGGTAAAVHALDNLGLSQSSPFFWGLSGLAGILGHDAAGALAAKNRTRLMQKLTPRS